MSNPWASEWNQPSQPKLRPSKEVVPVEPLIAMLDPNRDYGPRSYEQVLAEITAGLIRVESPVEVGRLPVLRDAKTHIVLPGSGPFAITDTGGAPTALHQTLVDYARQGGLQKVAAALDDVLENGTRMEKIKGADVLLKYTMPKAREAAPDDSIALALLDRLMATREQRVEVIEYRQ